MGERTSKTMTERSFDEMIAYFNHRVADMDINQDYKMELLGMVTALGFKHEKSAQLGIIHCQDCKWWASDEEGPYKSCNAARHCYYAKKWKIVIQRKYPGGFYCADAKTREEETEDESD